MNWEEEERVLVRNPEGKRPLERQDGGGWITLRWVEIG
jgi:hypothetical protein